MRIRIVRIGNSQGIRIPKPLLEEAGLTEEVEIMVKGRTLIIRSARPPRAGWAEAFKAMAGRGDDALLDPETPTRFDETEWRW